DAVRNLIADAAGFPLELDGHRVHLDLPRGRIRLCSRLRRVALSHSVRSPHVSAPDAAHDPADRRGRATVPLLLRARAARYAHRCHHGLLPDYTPLRRVDDKELHRRGTPRSGAGCGDTRRVTLAYRL